MLRSAATYKDVTWEWVTLFDLYARYNAWHSDEAKQYVHSLIKGAKRKKHPTKKNQREFDLIKVFRTVTEGTREQAMHEKVVGVSGEVDDAANGKVAMDAASKFYDGFLSLDKGGRAPPKPKAGGGGDDEEDGEGKKPRVGADKSERAPKKRKKDEEDDDGSEVGEEEVEEDEETKEEKMKVKSVKAPHLS